MFRFQKCAVNILIASPLVSANFFYCTALGEQPQWPAELVDADVSDAVLHALSQNNDSHCVFGPPSPDAQTAWLQDLKNERTKFLQNTSWAGGVFDNPSLTWTQTSYIQPQMHPYDRFFYDHEKKEYTVTKFLDDLKNRYGGIDSVLIWPTYPQTGIDDRNQFDFFRALPGGLVGVSNFVKELHDAGVKVLQPLKPWDNGTHQEPIDFAHTIAKLLKQTGADGVNGDTMPSIPEQYWRASVAVDHPLAFEPEIGGIDDALKWTTMGWGYFPSTSYFSVKVPVVDRFKFITGGKFMTNVCDRWSKDHTDNLQLAWFNGDGFESWENVWGVWNGITPRDGEAIRRVATMLRFFGKYGFLQSPDWEPHTDGLLNPTDVFASKWPLDDHAVLWTIVNRGDQDDQSYLVVEQAGVDLEYYDCYTGSKKKPETVEGQQRLNFDIEKGGFGCLLQLSVSSRGEDFDTDLALYLVQMRGLTLTPLSSYDSTWVFLQQTMVNMPQVSHVTSAPEGTVFVPRANFSFESQGLEIESFPDDDGVDAQFPWEQHPQRNHSHVLDLGPFYIDKFPVSATKYSSYLKASQYKPSDPYNWLRTWNGFSEPPPEVANLPVTHVSLEEARTYCAWVGGRLPHTSEWQYAAQGMDGRQYPWGDEDIQDNYPVEQSGLTHLGPEPVTAHSPAGDSTFGMADAVGNVWQYTDEFQDDHTRFVILKGGSNYRPSGSDWYYPQAKKLNQHNKYMLMDESYERASTVGFRCLYPEGNDDTGGPTVALIVGVTIGAILLVVVIVALCWVVSRRRAKQPGALLAQDDVSLQQDREVSLQKGRQRQVS